MHFEFTPKVIALRQQLLKFMDEHVYPNEHRHEQELAANARAGRAYAELPMMAGLKAKAREQGLWNLFLPPHPGDTVHASGLTKRPLMKLSYSGLKASLASGVLGLA